jgi:hypothetical protein
MYVKKCKKNSGICNIGAALKLSRFDRSKVTNIGQKLHARIAITRLERKNKLPKKTSPAAQGFAAHHYMRRND